MHPCKGFDGVAKYPRQFDSPFFTLGAIGICQQVESAFYAQALAVDFKAQPGDSFIKQPFPSVPDNPQIVQKLLKLVGQLIRLHRANAIKYRLIARKGAVGIQQRLQCGVIDPVQLKGEKNQWCGEIGDFLLHVRHEFRAVAING